MCQKPLRLFLFFCWIYVRIELMSKLVVFPHFFKERCKSQFPAIFLRETITSDWPSSPQKDGWNYCVDCLANQRRLFPSGKWRETDSCISLWGLKIFWLKKMLVEKHFWFKKNVGPKTYFCPKIFKAQNLLTQNIFYQNNFWSTKIFGS